MPLDLRVSLLERASEEGAIYGSKAVGEPPLMLAFATREALRQACAAFGPAGTSIDLPSPATPEAVFWALQEARAAHADTPDGDVDPGAGPRPPEPDPDAPERVPESEAALHELSEA
jgi:xanthine dehydrogenase large subunit